MQVPIIRLLYFETKYTDLESQARASAKIYEQTMQKLQEINNQNLEFRTKLQLFDKVTVEDEKKGILIQSLRAVR